MRTLNISQLWAASHVPVVQCERCYDRRYWVMLDWRVNYEKTTTRMPTGVRWRNVAVHQVISLHPSSSHPIHIPSPCIATLYHHVACFNSRPTCIYCHWKPTKLYILNLETSIKSCNVWLLDTIFILRWSVAMLPYILFKDGHAAADFNDMYVSNIIARYGPDNINLI